MSVVVSELVQRLPRDVVSTFGAGNHCAWAQYYIPTNEYPSQLGTRNGSMGYSIPSAIAAVLESPERLAVAICGDGEFLMNGQEFATAGQYGAPLLAIVMDNGQYGTIRSHQEAHYPGRVSGTQLANPDFAALARGYGAFGAVLDDDAEIGATIAAAVDAVRAGTPAVVHVKVDRALVLPSAN